MTSILTAPRGTSNDPPPPVVESERVVDPARRLPGGRAVLGGVLVACSALGLFAATRPHSSVPDTRYFVARHPLSPGHRIVRGDLTAVPMDLPSTVADTALDAASPVTGRVVLQSVPTGALVDRAALRAEGAARPDPLVAFSVEPDRAVAGDLVVGDRIDVYVTWDDAADNSTRVVARGLAVAAITHPGSDHFSDGGKLTLSVAIPADTPALPLIRAIRSGELTIVRTTGTGADR